MHLHFTGWSHPSPGRNALRMVWVQSGQEQLLILCSHTTGMGAVRTSCTSGPFLTVGATGLAQPALPAACAGQSTAAHIISIRKHRNPCSLRTPAQCVPSCGWRLSSWYSGWEGAPRLLATPVCCLQVCPFPGSLPVYATATGGWKARYRLSKEIAWSCELPTRPQWKTHWLSQLAATETSRSSGSPSSSFQKVLLGHYSGLPELTVCCVDTPTAG